MFFCIFWSGFVKSANRGQERGVDQMMVKEEMKFHVGQVLAKNVKKEGVFRMMLIKDAFSQVLVAK